MWCAEDVGLCSSDLWTLTDQWSFQKKGKRLRMMLKTITTVDIETSWDDDEEVDESGDDNDYADAIAVKSTCIHDGSTD